MWESGINYVMGPTSHIPSRQLIIYAVEEELSFELTEFHIKLTLVYIVSPTMKFVSFQTLYSEL